jgi:lipopolysaccharide/colanic/teichoic acid biosynthesis glycosyltransferase
MQGSRRLRGSQRFQEFSAADQMRRFGEYLIACMLLALTLPLMIIVAGAIKFESAGPVLDRRERIGPGGRRFQILSFRTIAQKPGQPGSTWQTTQVGQFLRYTRINALPQLFNVLRGDIRIIDTSLFE